MAKQTLHIRLRCNPFYSFSTVEPSNNKNDWPKKGVCVYNMEREQQKMGDRESEETFIKVIKYISKSNLSNRHSSNGRNLCRCVGVSVCVCVCFYGSKHDDVEAKICLACGKLEYTIHRIMLTSFSVRCFVEML